MSETAKSLTEKVIKAAESEAIIEYLEVESVKFYLPTDTCDYSIVITEINVKTIDREDIITLKVPVSILRDSFSAESKLVADSYKNYVIINSDYFETLSKRQGLDLFSAIVKIAKEVTKSVVQLNLINYNVAKK